MAVTTNVDGNWKSAEGTVSEVLSQLNADDVKIKDFDGFAQDGSGNFVAMYWNSG